MMLEKNGLISGGLRADVLDYSDIKIKSMQNKEKRPDIMDKIMGVANRMEDIEKEARKAGFPLR